MRRPQRTSLGALSSRVAGAIGVLVAGCSASPAQIEIPALTMRSDAGVLPDGGLRPPQGTIACTTSAECDDGVGCTIDRCVDGGYCHNINDNAACSDGDFCNGAEICDYALGCLPPTRPERCDDGDVCTLDVCSTLLQACVHTPRDSDRDGEVDWHCPGGTDCDDFAPAVGAARAELCMDGIDNDCDGASDEEVCGGPAHDTCTDAFELSAADLDGTTRELPTAGAARDYVLGCGAPTVRDMVFTFTLQTASDVEITAWGVLAGGSTETATVALRGVDCGAVGAELDCAEGFPAHLRTRALPAGRYHIIVDSAPAQRVAVRVTATPATQPPANQQCADALVIDAETRRFEVVGDFTDVSDLYEPACAGAPQGEAPPSQPDLVYSYTLAQERDVSIALSSLSGEQMTFSIRTACDDTASTLACRIAAPAIARLRRQPPGEYFLIIESPSYREVDYALELVFDEPTDPPSADACATVEDLPVGPVVAGSLVGKQPAVSASCHEDFLAPDAVYRLLVDEPRDVTLVVDGEGATMRMAVQAQCGLPAAELRCLAGSPVHARLRNLQPGEYFVAIDAPQPVPFTIQATYEDLSVPVDVAGNDSCPDAFPVPATGGVFTGDTGPLRNDYEGCADADLPDAAYRLELLRESAVRAHLDADFDAVLYRYGAACGGDSRACNDDSPFGGTGASLLEEVLPAGVYHYVVDGRNGAAGGPYVLDFEIMD